MAAADNVRVTAVYKNGSRKPLMQKPDAVRELWSGVHFSVWGELGPFTPDSVFEFIMPNGLSCIVNRIAYLVEDVGRQESDGETLSRLRRIVRWCGGGSDGSDGSGAPLHPEDDDFWVAPRDAAAADAPHRSAHGTPNNLSKGDQSQNANAAVDKYADDDDQGEDDDQEDGDDENVPVAGEDTDDDLAGDDDDDDVDDVCFCAADEDLDDDDDEEPDVRKGGRIIVDGVDVSEFVLDT
jgi:hypothetical protein